MRDDEDAAVDRLVHLLEHADEILEAPEVDAGLGFVEDGHLRAAGEHGRDLDALELAAGEAGIHFAVDIIPRTQADLGQIGAGLVRRELLAGGDADEVKDRNALEAHRLLESKADAAAGALGDGHVGDVLAVEQDLAGGRLLDTGDEFGHGGLAAAVRAGDDDHAFIDREAHVLEDLADTVVRFGLKAKVFEFKHWLVPSSLCFKSLDQKSSSSNLSDRSF